jgi:membrane protease YdiL (CAAX protease family)
MMTDKPITTPKVKWSQVIVYYVIACAISWPFFWWRDILHWEGFKGPNFSKTTLIMWGPGIAGIICLYLFRKTHVRTITFLGGSWMRSLIAWFVPFILLAIPGVTQENGEVSHSLPLLLCLFGALTVLGEEVGWRGFLQDALRPVKPVWRYLLIGVLWEAWHFTNRTHDKSLLQIMATLAIVIPITTLLSWLIGAAVERSKSILLAAAIHGWVDLLFEFPGIATYICAAVALVLWLYLLKTWPQPANITSPNDAGLPTI